VRGEGKKEQTHWENSSGVQCLPSIYKILGLNPKSHLGCFPNFSVLLVIRTSRVDTF
jgi:hypothetical protein